MSLCTYTEHLPMCVELTALFGLPQFNTNLFHCIQKMYQQKSIAAICPIFPLTWPDLDFQVVWLSRLSTNVYILALFFCWCALNSPHTSYLRIYALLWQFSVDSTFSFAMIGQLFTTRIPETFFIFYLNKMKTKRLSNHMSQYFIHNRT